MTSEVSARTTLWSPWSLAIAGLWALSSLLGLSATAAPDGEVGPVALALCLLFSTVAAAMAVRALFRRVIVEGSDITRVTMFRRETVHLRGVAEGDAEGASSLLWSTSVPVVVLGDGTEVALSELAGYDAFGRSNRRVQRACAVLSAAAAAE